MELISGTEITMSSHQIASLTGKEHKNVIRDIKAMLDNLGIDGSDLSHHDNRGYTSSFDLPKDLTLTLVSGYDVRLRHLIVKKLQELESKVNKPAWLQNISPQALTVIEDLNSQLETASKEVDRLQGVCNTITAQFTPGVSAPAFCIQLNGVNTSRVSAVLVAKGVFIKDRRGYRVTSYYRDLYFKQEVRTCHDHKESYKPVLTVRGAKWLYKLYLAHELPMKKAWDGKFDHMIFEELVA